MLSTLSHLALWAGLYVVGAVVYMQQVSGAALPPGRAALLAIYAFLTAVAVYLMDRVKLSDRWLDPADRAAQPHRFAFIERHSTRVRSAALILLAAATLLGWAISPLLSALTVGAALGVVVYAGRPRHRRPRVKDILLLKNSYVAAGITAFALTLTLAATLDLPSGLSTLSPTQLHAYALAAVTLFMRVVADAALCDIDDELSDRAHGTHTLPTTVGRGRAWLIAAAMRLAAALALWLIPAGRIDAQPAAHAWAIITIATTAGLWIWRPRRLRERVDGRLFLEACLAWIALRAGPC